MTGLALNRLDRRERLVLVQAVAGNAALPDEIMTAVFERADGVPLFVEELTKAVLETVDRSFLGRFRTAPVPRRTVAVGRRPKPFT